MEMRINKLSFLRRFGWFSRRFGFLCSFVLRLLWQKNRIDVWKNTPMSDCHTRKKLS
ncbi:hypothetical protein Hanom_Chr02g00162701 [Helianthus anomalus]